jgi:hypothetical protein
MRMILCLFFSLPTYLSASDLTVSWPNSLLGTWDASWKLLVGVAFAKGWSADDKWRLMQGLLALASCRLHLRCHVVS